MVSLSLINSGSMQKRFLQIWWKLLETRNYCSQHQNGLPERSDKCIRCKPPEPHADRWAFIGSMMAFLFCAMTMKAVGRAAGNMVEEVRRQFKAFPGILKGTQKPEYGKCVEISTIGAQKRCWFHLFWLS